MTPATEELRDARLTDLVERALPTTEADALLDDVTLRREVEEAREARALLRGLDRRPVPPDFLRKVQRRVRRKSGGRFFHPASQPLGFRLSVEVFVVVAIAVMAACFVLMDVGRVGPGPLVEEPPPPGHAVEPPAP
ncbi:MAG: hypothetical protein KC620_11155 [Myxococcales bacterium]|nr:hypothetical protein [Myxococcales bacterium]